MNASIFHGMAIVLVSSVTAELDSTRPGCNVVPAPNVIAPGSTMMVPRNVLVAPIEAPEGTQKTLVLAALAAPANATVTVGAEVRVPDERNT